MSKPITSPRSWAVFSFALFLPVACADAGDGPGSVASGGTSGFASGSASSSGGALGSGGKVATGGALTTSGGTGGASGGTPEATGGAGTGGEEATGGAAPEILAARPPMGWNSWNTFACDGLNENVVRATAEAFVSSGMKDAGYEYVNMDDCWMDGRGDDGKFKWNTTRFPSGIPALAEYVHSLGLKIGIYTTPNHLTCTGLYGNRPQMVGTLGHEETDAQTFAEWGIDYLKYDLCAGQMQSFFVMRDALKATGRDIFYSINPANQGPFCTPLDCANAPNNLDFNVVEVANMWRIEMDIWDGWNEVLRCIDANKELYVGAGPGHWNDPDMLEVGNPGLSDTESRAHFSMWAIMASPLITGNDLTKMSETTRLTLTNAEVIAVNQDALGYQGRVVASQGNNLEVWSKNLEGANRRAVALFNRGQGNAPMTVNWSDIGLPAGAATVRDLWAHEDLGSFSGSYTAGNVAGRTVTMLEIVSTP